MSEATPDTVSLNKDGTVRLLIDGEDYKLRRPKTGELISLREILAETDDAVTLLADEEDTDEVPEEETAAQGAVRIRRRNRRRLAKRDELYQGWVREAWATLGRKPLPDNVADWPPFLYQTEFIASLIEHWQSVPLDLGAQ